MWRTAGRPRPGGMTTEEIAEVLNRPLSRELLARDLARLAYVAKDGTPRSIPIAFTWNGEQVVLCTSKNAPKLHSLRANPVVALTSRLRGAPAEDPADPRHGRAGPGRRHPGGVPADERQLRDVGAAAGGVGARGALALRRRHGPDRDHADVGEADRLRDHVADAGAGAGAAAVSSTGSGPARGRRTPGLRRGRVRRRRGPWRGSRTRPAATAARTRSSGCPGG